MLKKVLADDEIELGIRKVQSLTGGEVKLAKLAGGVVSLQLLRRVAWSQSAVNGGQPEACTTDPVAEAELLADFRAPVDRRLAEVRPARLAEQRSGSGRQALESRSGEVQAAGHVSSGRCL